MLIDTYVHFTVDYVNETAQNDDKIEYIPGIAEVILFLWS